MNRFYCILGILIVIGMCLIDRFYSQPLKEKQYDLGHISSQLFFAYQIGGYIVLIIGAAFIGHFIDYFIKGKSPLK